MDLLAVGGLGVSEGMADGALSVGMDSGAADERANMQVSKLDQRKYRALTLDNELRVLLVSDSDSHNASAAMDVAVGHLSDPENLPGLAHFCEHMLFLGTEKYPEEDSYRQFLSLNGGYSNAFTSMECTNYHFQVVAGGLHEALDRFAQFFIAPLFTESATEREMNAVDSEAQKNLQSDSHRLFQLHKSFANEDHPYHKFGTGNRGTLWETPKLLGLNVREELLRFHREYYSANMMSLVLVAPEDLDSLEELARRLFGEVRNTGRKWPSQSYKDRRPFPETSSKIYVVPIKNVRHLDVIWTLPSTFEKYRVKSDRYLSHLLGHEGKGSILSMLKNQGWAAELVSGTLKNQDTFSTFEVRIQLTEEGCNHREEIIELIFGYFNLIHEAGIDAELYSECQLLAETNFLFQEREDCASLATRLCNGMRHFPPEHYLSGPLLYFEYDPVEIGKILDLLRSSPVLIFSVSKEYESIADSREKWFGTPYHSELISPEQMAAWRSAEPHEQLKLPERNAFIPTEFSLIESPCKIQPFPTVIRDSPGWRVYYLLDDIFKRPKTNIFISIESPLSYFSPRNYVMSCLIVRLVNDALEEYAYNAQLASLNYNLRTSNTGFSLSFDGFSHRVETLIEGVVKTIGSFKPARDRFEIVREALKRDFDNFSREQPYQQALYAVKYALEIPIWHIDDYSVEIVKITFEEFEQAAPLLLQKLYMEILMHGNLDQEKAEGIVKILEDGIPFEAVRQRERRRKRISQVPNTSKGLVYQMPVVDPNNSAILVYYEIGSFATEDFKLMGIIEVIAEMISEPAFTQLRTQEQLGYIVSSRLLVYENVVGIQFILQSSVKEPAYLDDRVEAFIASFEEETMNKLSTEEHERYIESLVTRKREKDKQLAKATRNLWKEILDQTHVYNRREREAEALPSITKEEVVEVFRRCLSVNSSERRKLSIHAHGKRHPIEESTRPDAQIIKDLNEFKDEVALHPLRVIGFS